MSLPARLPDQPPLKRIALAVAQLAEALHDLADQPAPVPEPTHRRGYLSPKEMALRTGDSPRAIAEWCQRGLIGAERHGRRWRIPEAAVEKFCARARARARVVGGARS